jgi:hypothetical protein
LQGGKLPATPFYYCRAESAEVVVPAPVVPAPAAPELAAPVPAVVVSTIGDTADESIGVVTVVESTVEGVVKVAESLDVAPLSVPLLQAAIAPAITNTANTFFMIVLCLCVYVRVV